MIRALALLALATPAAAFEIDYAKVFADHPEAVTATGPATRRADLPGDVHVVETAMSDGSHSYFAYDSGPYGATGCVFDILVDLTIASKACDGLLDDAQSATLGRNLLTVAGFVAENSVPAVPQDGIMDRLAALFERRTEEMFTAGIACPNGTDGNQQLLPMIQTLTSDEFTPTLNAILSVPRLPVPEPCM